MPASCSRRARRGPLAPWLRLRRAQRRRRPADHRRRIARASSAETMTADQLVERDGRASTGRPGVGRPPIRRVARSPPLAPARLRPLRAAPAGQRRTLWSRPQDRLLPRRPLPASTARRRPRRPPSRCTRAAAGSRDPGCSASARASRSATATTTRRTWRASTYRCPACGRVAIVLVHRVNADRRLRELDYGNNAASLLLSCGAATAAADRVLDACPATAHCSAGTQRARSR